MIVIKNERGITIIGLIITIVVLLILVSITISVGTESIDYSKTVKFIAYMQSIQKKVDLLSEYGDFENIGTAPTQQQLENLSEIIENDNTLNTTSSSQTLKFFNKSTIASDLELDNIDDEIIIDFATREVISLHGINYEGTMYYTQYNLPGGQKVEQFSQTQRTLNFNKPTVSINGLNATFTISGISISNGTLSYSKNYNEINPSLTEWTEITNYTVRGQDVTTGDITKSGVYYFKLVDNVNRNNAYISPQDKVITIRLSNSPSLKEDMELVRSTYNYSSLLANENWAYATLNNLEYVWIPRFAYKEENNEINIEFLKGTSDLTTSGGYIANNWTVPSVFENATGVWVRTNSYNTNDIIEIIDTGIILE